MVQWFNGTALKGLLTSKIPRLLNPDLHVASIASLNFEALREDFAAVIFDKDNCLTRPYKQSLEFPDAVCESMENFGDGCVAVLSNCIGCEDVEGAERFESMAGISVIRHLIKKPGCIEEIRAHFHGIPLKRIVLIGDRLSTDILIARKHGLFSILVDPITTEGENVAIVAARKLERLWLNWNKHRNSPEYIKYIT